MHHFEKIDFKIIDYYDGINLTEILLNKGETVIFPDIEHLPYLKKEGFKMIGTMNVYYKFINNFIFIIDVGFSAFHCKSYISKKAYINYTDNNASFYTSDRGISTFDVFHLIRNHDFVISNKTPCNESINILRSGKYRYDADYKIEDKLYISHTKHNQDKNDFIIECFGYHREEKFNTMLPAYLEFKNEKLNNFQLVNFDKYFKIRNVAKFNEYFDFIDLNSITVGNHYNELISNVIDRLSDELISMVVL